MEMSEFGDVITELGNRENKLVSAIAKATSSVDASIVGELEFALVESRRKIEDLEAQVRYKLPFLIR